MFPLLSRERALEVAKQHGMRWPSAAARLNVFRMLLGANPKIAAAMWKQVSTILNDGVLPRIHRELIIMRIGWKTDAAYEWEQHYRIAVHEYKLDKELILATRLEDPSTCGLFDESHVAVLRATDEVLRDGQISDATWVVLQGTIPDPAARAEVPVCIANWLQFSVLLRSLRMPPDGPVAWPPHNEGPYPTSTRALLLEGPSRTSLTTFPVSLDPGTAVLRVEANGICGTDNELFSHQVKPAGPVVLGHEAVGRIVAIGARASMVWGISRGQRVALSCFLSCRRCKACASGCETRCQKYGQPFYGFFPSNGKVALGGFADYQALHPDSLLLPVPDTIPLKAAALYNAVGGGLQWGRIVPRTTTGDTVVICGCGVRGIVAALAARDAGAASVCITGYGPNDSARLEVARSLGLSTVDAQEHGTRLPQAVRAALGGRLASVVVDLTARNPDALAQCVSLCAHGGRIVLAALQGTHADGRLTSDRIVQKEITVTGSYGVASREYLQALAWLERSPELFAQIPAHELHSLEEVADFLSSQQTTKEPKPLFAMYRPLDALTSKL